MNSSTPIRIGVDLGGTKIEVAALNAAGDIIFRKRLATPINNYSATIETVATLINKAESYIGLTGKNQLATVGIATPGALTNGTIKNSNSVCLNGMPLKTDFEAALNRPVRLSNDANCFTLSEAMDGAAKGQANVFGVIVGTGTGAGIVLNGILINGVNAIAGEWGHNELPWQVESDMPVYQCYCGKQACIETYLSGPGFARRYNDAYCSDENDLKQSALEVVQLAEAGGEQAQQHLNLYYHRMARALASVINIIDPNIIVLGGGMSNIQGLYDNVPKLWQHYIFSDSVKTKLVAPKHGDSSGVRGAAWLWNSEDYE